jgi:alpha-galactosidase
MANMAFQGMERLKITAAGLNHFTWMLALQDRRSGEDLYPLFRREWQKLPADFEPLTRDIFDIFKLFPIPGDEHLDEYLPWLSNAAHKAWERYDLSLYDWTLFEQLRQAQWRQVSEWIANRNLNETLTEPVSEGAVELIESFVTGVPLYWEALNIPNRGLIHGLPENAIVEVPGTVSKDGIQGEGVCALPQGILELLHREVSASQLCIDAVVLGDRDLALQSLLLDPVVDDISTARLILNDILETNRTWLPQFH